MKNNFVRYPSPGPLARATLSRWERDSLNSKWEL